jgi:hypothetical protein
MTLENLAVAWAPFLPWYAIAGFAVLATVFLGYGWLRRARGMGWRAAAFAILLLALANPSAVIEDRVPLDDIGLVLVDQSPSQTLGERRAQSEAALAALEREAKGLKHFELRVVRTTGQNPSARDSGTELFKALDRSLAEIPRQRYAGAVMITDGQVHDAPAGAPSSGAASTPAAAGGESEAALSGPDAAALAHQLGAPLHVLLTGAPDEGDRRLTVVEAPSYGLVGKEVTIAVRVDDLPGPAHGQAQLTLRRDGGETKVEPVEIGTVTRIPVTIAHEGQTVFEISVEPGPRELTLLNNRAIVVVNGVRDRLRVLLVSGEPHPGERAIRNLLKSDPSVDLVHFTILRPPEKLDATPVRELSLITFPVHELFEVKLSEFDLVIFDRYQRRGELGNNYFQNIVDYVNRGGALFVVASTSFSSVTSVYLSPLADAIPAEPTGQVLERGFRPELTEIGRRHPVTAGLPGADDPTHPWGRWFREIAVRPKSGDTLMTGIDGLPLLQLARVGKGRAALLASDEMWLWARGYEGGGPEAELLRRVAHWLMKEPDLEEEDLRAATDGNRIDVIRRSLDPKPVPVTVTAPSGKSATLDLAASHGGETTGTVTADELGLYRIADGTHVALAAVGPLNPIEFRDVRATAERLAPIADASGGAVRWLVQGGVPELRTIDHGRDYAGAAATGAWIGFKGNGDYRVTGVRQAPLLPGLLVLAAALLAFALAWRREGK